MREPINAHFTVPFVDHEGELYVPLLLVMHPLLAEYDKVNVYKLEGDGHEVYYLKVTDALDWCAKEREAYDEGHRMHDVYSVMITTMGEALAELRGTGG